MRQGRVNIVIDANEITEVSIESELDDTFERMFLNARRSVKRNSESPERGIKVLVFGCFWLEALYNRYLRYLIIDSLEAKEITDSIWDTIKRSRFIEKFLIFSSFADKSQEEDWKDLAKRIDHVFQLRNRLAHFKESKQLIAEGPLPLVNALLHAFNAPDPPLKTELTGDKIIEYANTIRETKNWLYKMLGRYRKKYPFERNLPEPDEDKRKKLDEEIDELMHRINSWIDEEELTGKGTN